MTTDYDTPIELSYYPLPTSIHLPTHQPLGIAIGISLPESVIIVFYVLHASKPMYSKLDILVEAVETPYLIAVIVKMFLVTFTLSGYILILWSVNREKSAMSTSASKKHSHVTIILQALPIALYSVLFLFFDLFMKFFLINYFPLQSAIIYLIFVFTSGVLLLISRGSRSALGHDVSAVVERNDGEELEQLGPAPLLLLLVCSTESRGGWTIIYLNSYRATRSRIFFDFFQPLDFLVLTPWRIPVSPTKRVVGHQDHPTRSSLILSELGPGPGAFTSVSNSDPIEGTLDLFAL
ncbi:unnamed protein product [Caenorhabditis auriculariae]|uniref:Uncharacterized protein n=1 Tax=Caenorhabditis auriculariae TaxID=2777116 RepID=A0A8S1HK14_9PELO|nr:unnamed protein product [Caenorhabditis auriculariae]